MLNDPSNISAIKNTLNEVGVTWHLIPARSPHFGGLWEAGVKSVKRHLMRVGSQTSLTYEEYNTLLIQIEAILNSRPISPLSNDPNDPNPLTPSHFLIGRTLTSLPEPSLADVSDNRLSKFEHVQKIKQHFWKRWSKEYVSELQSRTKWKQQQEALLQEGALVVLKEDNLPPLKWRLG
ncbi:uncharacterized protein LOC108736259 [Agrilus planipennis]|uniref:Uncharacterized protein LOC108736259 n=1 Tax=Agrilus planipennis TaxID=224129 RepID=A0A1W4WJL9_AGRPL|nr:uncharacterized protein LOC108736259 [Agrilus planipennis]